MDAHKVLVQRVRQTSFPISSRHAIKLVGRMCTDLLSGVQQPPSAEPISSSISGVCDVIFFRVDHRTMRRHVLSHIEELQLLEIINDYFTTAPVHMDVKKTVFLYLFPPTCADRYTTLTKLVSMAVSLKNATVLTACGHWMQYVGNASKVCLDLAENVIKDFFILVPKAVIDFQHLPQLAPYFTANLLTALGAIYCTNGMKDTANFPPKKLVEVVTKWISENHSLCIAGYQQQLVVVPGLPPPIGDIPVTAFAGLFKWCVVAPLFLEKDDVLAYTKLHLALLTSLQECCSTHSCFIYSQHLVEIGMPIKQWSNANGTVDDRLEQAVDVFMQIVQVTVSNTHCLHGDKQILLDELKSLPSNRLLNILIRKFDKK